MEIKRPGHEPDQSPYIMPSLSECSYTITPPSAFMTCPKIMLLSFLFLFPFIITAYSLILSFFPCFASIFTFPFFLFILLSLPLPCFLLLFTPYKQISLLCFYYFFFICFYSLALIFCLLSSSFFVPLFSSLCFLLLLTFWRRNYFLILAHSVYKM